MSPIKLSIARNNYSPLGESSVSDIPAGDAKIANHSYSALSFPSPDSSKPSVDCPFNSACLAVSPLLVGTSGLPAAARLPRFVMMQVLQNISIKYLSSPFEARKS